jgi:hypothetical protein
LDFVIAGAGDNPNSIDTDIILLHNPVNRNIIIARVVRQQYPRMS